jgi:hypothetical protein
MKGMHAAVLVAMLLSLAGAVLLIQEEQPGMGNVNVEGENVISGTGTVVYVRLEGGFYGIIGNDGKRYYPLNLPEEYRVDGLTVRFEGVLRSDVATFHMWGTPIELRNIEVLGPSQGLNSE